MFSTFTQRLLLGIYIFILLSIPAGTYLVSQYQTSKSSAQEQKTTKKLAQVTPKPATSPAQELLNTSQTTVSQGTPATPAPSPSPTITTSYGPTLSFKTSLEGSPADNQTTSMFVGIMEGTVSSNPRFLLSFTVDLPASGEYSGLSLAGLNPGTSYTAILKGSGQIATSSAFVMSPNVTSLNNNQPLNLTSGDLNDDNVIDEADYSIAQKALGSTSSSSGWNANADLNKDGVINAFDLAIIAKNIGQIGASGIWTSPVPQPSPSASLNTPASSIGGPPEGNGYWIWVPKSP